MEFAAIILIAVLQAAPADRAHAEELARAGRNAEAIALFERVVEANPADVEARLWVAILSLRLGRTADAEALFRSVLRDHPANVDARIGLANVLTRTGGWTEALDLLIATEQDAGQNADLFAALARAYRRSGDDDKALEYFRRARALSPDDADVALGFENVARTYGHWIGFELFRQTDQFDNVVQAYTLLGSIRATRRTHVEVSARTQQGPSYSDAIAGGGVVLRVGRATTAAMHVSGGANNAALATLDFSAEAMHYHGMFEIGGSVRRMIFNTSNLTALSPQFAWDREPWRVDARYTVSRSTFDPVARSNLDHSVVIRPTWQAWRRIALQGAFAYGIESFDELTVDRLFTLDKTTLGAAVRIDAPSLTRLTLAWEHQGRSNNRPVDRFTFTVIQAIP